MTVQRAAGATLLFVLLWQAAAWGTYALQWRGASETARNFGWGGLYLLGLSWMIWCMERAAQRLETSRRLVVRPLLAGPVSVVAGQRLWNPIDPDAWYYGRHSQRLKQSFAALTVYSLAFLLFYLLLTRSYGGVDPYELPEGGGQEMMRQTVQIQRVIRKKYVINPYSSILFNPPPIDQVDPKLMEVTQNQYMVGQGGGSGAGFSKGTGRGKVRFIRLKHSDRFWDKNFGIGGDLNMLSEYAARTRQKVADKSEYYEVSQLSAFPPKKSPPMVYVTGSQTFLLAPADKKVLRAYVLEKHGMIVGDNNGGRQFHDQFIAALREITGVQEVPVARDDVIHRQPYLLPALPIVVAHGGSVPLGWNVDGRWVAYYHPGALSDAWRDDHAGIKREIYEECYQLGVNILYYAHAEYNKWLQSQLP